MLKVDNRNTRKKCEMCLNLVIKAPERRHWRCSSVFNVNFEHILTFFSVSFVEFEKVNLTWQLFCRRPSANCFWKFEWISWDDWSICRLVPEAYSQPCQTSKMGLVCENSLRLLAVTILEKRFILGVDRILNMPLGSWK